MLYVHIIEKSFLAQVVPLFHHRDFLNCRPQAQKMHISKMFGHLLLRKSSILLQLLTWQWIDLPLMYYRKEKLSHIYS